MSVTVSHSWLVAWLRICTVAPGTIAPLVSRTVPVTLAVVVCAFASVGGRRHKKERQKTKRQTTVTGRLGAGDKANRIMTSPADPKGSALHPRWSEPANASTIRGAR